MTQIQKLHAEFIKAHEEEQTLELEMERIEHELEVAHKRLRICERRYAEECARRAGVEINMIVKVPAFKDDRWVERHWMRVTNFYILVDNVSGKESIRVGGYAVSDNKRSVLTSTHSVELEKICVGKV